MKTLLKGAQVFTQNSKYKFERMDLLVDSDKKSVSAVSPFFTQSPSLSLSQNSCLIDSVINLNNKYIIPGFVDVHVHLREPGFFYKETIKTGTMAAAHGGYTTICPMPNVKPAPSDLPGLKAQLDIIEKDAVVRVIPYGTITEKGDGRSKLANMIDTAPYVIGFSDDGRGVQAGDLMEEAMKVAKDLGKPIVAHCEDETLVKGGYIHDGTYAMAHGHKGISSESEWVQVARDLELAAKTGCKYHVCHISTKETVSIIRKAKASGIDVTCETGPHYLVLTDEDIREDGKFKMNPPLRSFEDKEALIEGIKDGTIDMIATDHAPHTAEEKSKRLEHSAFGIVGLETAFGVMNTHLVDKGIITLEKLIELMSINPRKRFDVEGPLGFGSDEILADLTVLDLDKEWSVNTKEFFSMGKATPFEGWNLKGKPVLTMVDGKIKFAEL